MYLALQSFGTPMVLPAGNDKDTFSTTLRSSAAKQPGHPCIYLQLQTLS
jgi:hypothetical protein